MVCMQVLLDSDLDDEQRHYSKIVYNSTCALLSIVNDILDLSKIEAGKLDFDIRSFDLEVAIEDIVSLPELQARQKGVEFTYSIDSTIPRLLKGDIRRMRPLPRNLGEPALGFPLQNCWLKKWGVKSGRKVSRWSAAPFGLTCHWKNNPRETFPLTLPVGR